MKRRVLLGAATMLVVLGAGTWFVVTRDDGSTQASYSVGDGVRSGAGTALPDGFEVAPGSSLLGPVVVDGVDAAGTPTSWFAVLLVEDDPVTVWKSYAAQVAEFAPDSGVDASVAPGCRTADLIPGDEVCDLIGAVVDSDGTTRSMQASMASTPGDVTGAYLLRLDRYRYPTRAGYGVDPMPPEPWRGDPLPAPYPARPRPSVGEPLAPETVAYDGDNGRYVLLEGSELVAQYSDGSVTGGFGVLLRMTDGADLDAVTQAYVEQATQFEGEPVPPPEVIEHAGTTVRVYVPPGGAGGYDGMLWSVDQPAGKDDYLVYELIND
jgi:hypothetical protein